MKSALIPALVLASIAAAQQPPQRRLPDAIEAHRDLAYAGTDNPRQKLDLYLPKKRASDKPLPVIVFIHGGGWRNGDKGRGSRVLSYVASGEYAGVSVGYRLSNEAQFPAQIHDCKAAIRWVRANAKQYNLDADRIGVWGTSAGGHLVSLLGTSGGLKELEGDLGPHKNVSSRVTCVVNYFGPQNFMTMAQKQNDNASTAVASLLGGTAKEKPDAAKSASPVTHVTRDDPPFLHAHGTNDPTVPYSQATEIDAALKKAGVQSLLMEVTGAGHGFNSTEIEDRVKAFFAMHLRGVRSDIATTPVTSAPREPRRQ
jgi:acetyl esterase/lipase